MSKGCPDCSHNPLLHMAHGCPLCLECDRPGPYVPAPTPDEDGRWHPPGTVGAQWVRLNRRTRLYEFWPPDDPTQLLTDTEAGRDA